MAESVRQRVEKLLPSKTDGHLKQTKRTQSQENCKTAKKFKLIAFHNCTSYSITFKQWKTRSLNAACTMRRKLSGRFSKELNIVFAFPKSIIQSQLDVHVLCLIQNQACQHGKTKHRLAPLELASSYHPSTANHPITRIGYYRSISRL